MKLSLTRCLFAIGVLFLCSGCESETQRELAELKLTSDDRRSKIEAVLKLCREHDPPGDEYQLRAELLEKLQRGEGLLESESIEEELRKQIADLVRQQRLQLETLNQELSVAADEPINFSSGPDQNAGTLLLNDADDFDSVEFDRRNQIHADWYLSDYDSDQDAIERQRKLHSIDYLLVLRINDIALPEYTGKDEDGSSLYSLGAIECDAFLYAVDTEELLMSFRFVAPNQRATLGFGFTDFLLSDDPDEGVPYLTDRLFSTAHEFAAAAAAELSDSIQCDKTIKRDLLGTRLELTTP